MEETVLIDFRSSLVEAMPPVLLADRTTGRNIVWATRIYEEYGAAYAAESEMKAESVMALAPAIIQPRSAKAKEAQRERTRIHAEVTTPAYICNRMASFFDDDWLGRKSPPFNFSVSRMPRKPPKRRRG